MGFDVSPWLERIENEFGHAALISFLLEKGGREIFVRRKNLPQPAGDSTQMILEWLRRELGAGKWVVPLGPIGVRARTAFGILRGLQDGKSLGQLAGELGLHLSTVSRWKSILRRRGLLSDTLSNLKGTSR